MSEEKFTKGEWEIEHDNCDKGGGEWYIVGPAKVEYSYRCTATEATEAIANAHLIAVAPKMYDMLFNISQGNGARVIQSLDKDEIKELLAEARGEDYE